MDSPIVARGDSSFDGFEVIAEPLAKRESRIFRRADGHSGTTYESHSLKLARLAGAPPLGTPQADHNPGLYVLLEHGGGRRVIALHLCYNNPAALEALLTMPEAALYGVLYGFASAVEAADYAARRETGREYAAAFVEGRLKKSRPRQGRRTVTIEPRPAATSTAQLIGES